MTEDKWLSATDPEVLLKAARGLTERKIRLFACGCCRRLGPLVSDSRCRTAIGLAEQVADYEVGQAELDRSLADLVQARRDSFEQRSLSYTPTVEMVSVLAGQTAPWSLQLDWAFQVAQKARDVVYYHLLALRSTTASDSSYQERVQQAALVRCLLGNPFRPSPVLASRRFWNSPTVVDIARAIYSERRFHDLPVLADALEEAGCDHADLLGHCRSGGDHVRGCWAVDFLLGKT